jgi:transcriptional regulator with XRE-family HTH domain
MHTIGVMTRLAAILKGNGVKPSHLARDAGVSRQHLLRLRCGTVDPTLHMMVILATAARRILGRKVSVGEMFDLGDGEPKR